MSFSSSAVDRECGYRLGTTARLIAAGLATALCRRFPHHPGPGASLLPRLGSAPRPCSGNQAVRVADLGWPRSSAFTGQTTQSPGTNRLAASVSGPGPRAAQSCLPCAAPSGKHDGSLSACALIEPTRVTLMRAEMKAFPAGIFMRHLAYYLWSGRRGGAQTASFGSPFHKAAPTRTRLHLCAVKQMSGQVVGARPYSRRTRIRGLPGEQPETRIDGSAPASGAPIGLCRRLMYQPIRWPLWTTQAGPESHPSPEQLFERGNQLCLSTST